MAKRKIKNMYNQLKAEFYSLAKKEYKKDSKIKKLLIDHIVDEMYYYYEDDWWDFIQDALLNGLKSKPFNKMNTSELIDYYLNMRIGRVIEQKYYDFELKDALCGIGIEIPEVDPELTNLN
jgi:hypothetical protein